MLILKRPPGDNFTFRQFIKLTQQIKQPKDVFYLWSSCIDSSHRKISHFIGTQEFYEDEVFYRNKLMDNIRQDLVVLGIKDHLTSINFNPWTEQKPNIVGYLEDMFNYYRDKQFIIFTSLENLNLYIESPNVKIIPWGGDITNHEREYKTLDPILNKNLGSGYSYLSLNRNKRVHRATLVSLLYGLGLENTGLISCMFKNDLEDLYSYTDWPKNPTVTKGFIKFKRSTLLLKDEYDIYVNGHNDNVSNFRNKLSNYYRDTFVDIITETSFTEKCFNLTEKTLNSIYGCSFPILLCSQGSVEFLRKMGVDMFDDVVNHSYDKIEDPFKRLYQAIVDNRDLLSDVEKSKELWSSCRSRFQENVNFAKTELYTFYSERTNRLFNVL
jgi:hypothetical protein